MRTFLLSLVLAASAFGQLKTPGTIGPVLSQPTGETIVIPFTDVQFSYTAYATAWWTQGANTGTAGACQFWSYSNLLFGQKPDFWVLNLANQHWEGPYRMGDTAPGGGELRVSAGSLCTFNITQAKWQADPTDITKGTISVPVEYAPGAPTWLYVQSYSYADNRTSYYRERPACTPPPPGTLPPTGCPQ